MLSIVDPTQITPADVYLQARLVDSKTTRTRDRGWYQDPFELTYQWHLWFDGGRVVCSATFARDQNRWRPGPEVSLASLTTGEGVSVAFEQLLDRNHFGRPPKALGVIFHVADEFALAQVMHRGSETEIEASEFAALHYNLIEDPCEVLVDREVSVETTSWRLLPFWGAARGQVNCAAIALSRSREAFLQTLLNLGEEWCVPIRVALTSAPMETLAALPLIHSSFAGGRLVAVNYLRFTAVFAITANGELRSARALLHRGSAPVPLGFADILSNMAVSAELAGPGCPGGTTPEVLFVSDNADALLSVQKDLAAYSASRLSIKLERVALSSLAALKEIPGNRPEFLVYAHKLGEEVVGAETAVSASQTFPFLWKDYLRSCNFFDVARMDSLYPTRQDLQLLRASRALVKIVAVGLLGAVGYALYSLMNTMSHPSWDLSPQEVKRAEDLHAKLLAERRQLEITRALFQPRSRGWVALDFLLQLFPEDSGVRVESFHYTVDAARSAPAGLKGQGAASTGFGRTWVLKGFANPRALDLLGRLNTQSGRSELFARVSRAAGDSSYSPDPTRVIAVTQTQTRNPKYDPGAGVAEVARTPALGFPYTFEITVNQSFTERDALAFPTEKPF